MSLVTTAWLAGHLSDPALRVLDASWYLPSAGRDARAEYVAGHVPGARFFDLDAASAHDTPLPHMLPTPEAFAAYVGALGVGDEHDVVVYDGSGVNLSAPRVWWMFRAFGHDRVSVLDGGLGKWRAEGRPLEAGGNSSETARFTPRPRPELVRDLAAMASRVAAGDSQIVDMRSAGRFAGRDPEPRPGLRGGHMPGSVNLPFNELVNPDGTALDEAALRARLGAAGIDLGRPVVASCGSGTSACALLLNLDRLGVRDAALYDGSWSEWGGSDEAVETERP
ncbi:MAG: 3-mercaptopyruvate sulfurtransferase [Gemmatimonadaceae bacterium]